jgi:hypothetical protein
MPHAVAGQLETPVRQRTPWFAPAQNPARRGAYEVCWDYGDEVLLFYNRWDGRRWHWGNKELDARALASYAPAKKRGNPQMIAWRGLASA